MVELSYESHILKYPKQRSKKIPKWKNYKKIDRQDLIVDRGN
jgi:hypothetical protein